MEIRVTIQYVMHQAQQTVIYKGGSLSNLQMPSKNMIIQAVYCATMTR